LNLGDLLERQLCPRRLLVFGDVQTDPGVVHENVEAVELLAHLFEPGGNR